MVEVAASKVAVPVGAMDTPRDVRAAAVPPSSVTEVPSPDRLGMAVTMSAVPDEVLAESDESRSACGTEQGERCEEGCGGCF